MTISDQLLAALVVYGLPVLFGVIMLASIGLPLPATLLLIASGAFVDEGQFPLGWVVATTACAAILGDNIGYALGRWGGRRAVGRLAGWVGGESRLRQAEAVAARWGGVGIFLSRWLVSPVGPAVNLTSGITADPWPAFLLYDVLGELVWVGLYVTLGRIFSDRVQALSTLLGNLGWVIVGILLVVVLAWKLAQHYRSGHSHQAESVVRSQTDG